MQLSLHETLLQFCWGLWSMLKKVNGGLNFINLELKNTVGPES